jgi:predicted thioesterase
MANHGQMSRSGLVPLSGCAVGETVAFAAHLEDVDVVGHSVEKCLEAHFDEQKISLATDKKVRIFGILLRDGLQGSAASDDQLIELIELSK